MSQPKRQTAQAKPQPKRQNVPAIPKSLTAPIRLPQRIAQRSSLLRLPLLPPPRPARLSAELDIRDPDFIRERLPALWLVSRMWFRSEVRGLGNIPEKGPVILVGNHSGGTMTPDTLVFTVAFSSYFGVERRLHQLTHSRIFNYPGLQFLRKFGAVPDSPQMADRALQANSALLLYPGGRDEAHRPSWHGNRIELGDSTQFIDLAITHKAPIVPVVAIGGQETALFLGRGSRIAKNLRLDKLLGVKRLPLGVSLPWGINVGDALGHMPLPAQITVEALPPIDIREKFGKQPDRKKVHTHIQRLMQETLDALAGERTFPVLG